MTEIKTNECQLVRFIRFRYEYIVAKLLTLHIVRN